MKSFAYAVHGVVTRNKWAIKFATKYLRGDVAIQGHDYRKWPVLQSEIHSVVDIIDGCRALIGISEFIYLVTPSELGPKCNQIILCFIFGAW